MFPLPLGVVICNFQKAHAPARTSSPNVLPKGMELSTGVGWFTYVIISPKVALILAILFACARCLLDSSSLSLVVFPNRNRLISLVATSVRHLASCRHHPLCMYLATIAAGRLITTRYACISRISLAFASRWSSPCYACISCQNNRCRRLLLSSHMYTKFYQPFTLSIRVQFVCWERWGGSFF